MVSSGCQGSDKHTAVKAVTAWGKALQSIYGREAGFGIVERQQFAAHAAPVAHGRVLGLEVEVLGQLLGEAALCGDVGEGVGCAVGEDVRLRYLYNWDAGGELVEAAGDGYWLYRKDATAEAVVIDIPLAQGAIYG